jgi:hypothetical protein
MDLAFSDIVDGQYTLGDRCHQQRQGAVPVWVVTDVHGNILINNQAELEGKKVWVVSKGRITVTRFWSASTAMIVCNVEQLGRKPEDKPHILPMLPDHAIRVLSRGRGYGRVPYPLDKNDEICIWCGYIESLRPVSQEDLRQGRLVRTFVGVIDTLVGSGTVNQGSTLIIQCRDRMKYLMDSMSTYNSTDMAPIGLALQAEQDENQTGLDTLKNGDTISRAQIILEIARRSIGHLENAYSISQKPEGPSGPCSSVCGLRISKGYVRDFISDIESADDIYGVYDAPVGDRDYFGIEMSESTAPPPNTAETPGGLDWVDDSRLDLKGQANKYLGLIERYGLSRPSGYGGIVTGSTNLFNTWTQYDVDVLRETFLTQYREKYGKDFEVPENTPTEYEAVAIRLLDEVDATLTSQELGIKYTELALKHGVVIPVGSAAIDVRAKFLEEYMRKSGRHWALDDPSFQGELQELRRDLTKKNTPFIGGTTRTPKGLSDIELAIRARHPAFNIITGRKAYDTAEDGKNFTGMSAQVTDRVPVEYIKFLAMQEPWPTEFYCDHRSGEYWYVPRGIDVTGLSDPKRFRRTYFFRHASQEVLSTLNQPYAHPGQALLLFREESSCINWRSNIIVTNTPHAQESQSYAVHLKVVPSFLQGRAFACTYYTVVDATIGGQPVELFATAMAFARLYGKELRAASMHVIGDPTLCPGEAVQVLGSPLYGGGYNPAVQDPSKEQWQWDREAVLAYYNEYKSLHKGVLDELRNKVKGVDDDEANRILEEIYGQDESDMTPAEIIKKYQELAIENGLGAITYIPDNITDPDKQAEYIKEEFQKLYNAKYQGKPDAPQAATPANQLITETLRSEQGMTPLQIIEKYNKLAKDYGLGNLQQPDPNSPEGARVPFIKAEFANAFERKFRVSYTEAQNTMREYLREQRSASGKDPGALTSLESLVSQTRTTDAISTDELTQAELMCPATFAGLDTAKAPLDLRTDEEIAAEQQSNASGDSTNSSGSTATSGNAGSVLGDAATSSSSNEAADGNNSSRPSNTGGMNVDKEAVYIEDPKTVWRIEAVIHKFNDSPGDGYKTEVALLTPW